MAIAITAGVAAVVLLISRDADDEVSSSATTSSTTSAPTSSTATSSPSTSSSVTTTSSTAATSTTTTQPSNRPGAVDELSAQPGGGSGEIVLEWGAVPGATGYRVLRSTAMNGSFATVADIDVTDGSATAADNVVNVWSERHSYIPPGGTMSSPDPSPWYQYVEVAAGQQFFQVLAYNTSGEGPPSAVISSGPR
jgi:hypothetical protein